MTDTYSKTEIKLIHQNVEHKLDDINAIVKDVKADVKELNNKVGIQNGRVSKNEDALKTLLEQNAELYKNYSNVSGQILAFKTDKDAQKDNYIKSLEERINGFNNEDKEEKGERSKLYKRGAFILLLILLFILIKIGVISKEFIDFIL